MPVISELAGSPLLWYSGFNVAHKCSVVGRLRDNAWPQTGDEGLNSNTGSAQQTGVI